MTARLTAKRPTKDAAPIPRTSLLLSPTSRTVGLPENGPSSVATRAAWRRTKVIAEVPPEGRGNAP
jgi:hypothetical protein